MSPGRFDLARPGRVLLVTGAASGLGLASAEVFAEAGYHLVLVDRDAVGLAAAAAGLRERGFEKVLTVVADVTSATEVADAFEAAVTSFGAVEMVFHAAGISGRGGTLDNLEIPDVEAVLDVNLKGTFVVCREALRALRGREGHLLTVGSITAEHSSAYYTAYAASKAGVIALTQGLARRAGRFNIRVNCLNPGSISGTGLMGAEEAHFSPAERQARLAAGLTHIPLGRRASPRDVAHLALFLDSPLARHIHGAVVTIDGGESLRFH